MCLFEVRSGEIIAVLGQSGIGKTTLIRTIAGLVQPRQGSVELKLPEHGGLGYIPQRLSWCDMQVSITTSVSVQEQAYHGSKGTEKNALVE